MIPQISCMKKLSCHIQPCGWAGPCKQKLEWLHRDRPPLLANRKDSSWGFTLSQKNPILCPNFKENHLQRPVCWPWALQLKGHQDVRLGFPAKPSSPCPGLSSIFAWWSWPTEDTWQGEFSSPAQQAMWSKLREVTVQVSLEVLWGSGPKLARSPALKLFGAD